MWPQDREPRLDPPERVQQGGGADVGARTWVAIVISVSVRRAVADEDVDVRGDQLELRREPLKVADVARGNPRVVKRTEDYFKANGVGLQPLPAPRIS